MVGEQKTDYINSPLIFSSNLVQFRTAQKTQINAQEFPNVKSDLI